MTTAWPRHARALVALARPRMLPFVLGLVGLGFGYGHWERALPLRGVPALLAVLASWALLHAGTLWWNAQLDRDEGPVLLGEPAPVPPGIGGAAAVAWVGCLGMAVLSGVPTAVACAAVAVLLSVLYSHPRTAWKGHPVGGPVVNVVGYGVCSPVVGWAVVGTSATPRGLGVLAVIAAAVVGSFHLAQAFQAEEDRARGYRTLAATHGPEAAVTAARLGFGAAWCGVFALAVAGWLPRALGLTLPAAWWVDASLRSWHPVDEGVVGAVEVARRLAWSVAAGLVILGAVYVRDSLSGGPVAGLATVAGTP